MDIDAASVMELLQLRNSSYAADLLVAAVVRLDVLTVMLEEPAALDELCAANDIAYRSADVLCTLLRSLDLLEPGEILRPTPLAAACLTGGALYDLRPELAACASRPRCLTYAEVLRTGRPATTRGDQGAELTQLGATMADELLANALAEKLSEQLDWLDARSILEVGGQGHFALQVGSRRKDPPAALPDPLEAPPEGHDLHLLPGVLHRCNREQVQQIVSRSYSTLEPRGWIVDYDLHLDASKTGPPPAARYSARLLHDTEGQVWSAPEVTDFLRDAGFINITQRPAMAHHTAILAQKPPTRQSIVRPSRDDQPL